MKYICFQCEGDVLEVFTFPRTVNHDDMAGAVMSLTEQGRTPARGQVRVFRAPISAGFVRPGGKCYGRSATLGLDSDSKRDSQILAQQLHKA